MELAIVRYKVYWENSDIVSGEFHGTPKALEKGSPQHLQSVCGPLFRFILLSTATQLYPTGLTRGLGSFSMNSTMPSGLRILMKRSTWEEYVDIVSCLQPEVLKKALVAFNPIEYLSCPDEIVKTVVHGLQVGEKGVDIAHCKIWVLLGCVDSIKVTS